MATEKEERGDLEGKRGGSSRSEQHESGYTILTWLRCLKYQNKCQVGFWTSEPESGRD